MRDRCQPVSKPGNMHSYSGGERDVGQKSQNKPKNSLMSGGQKACQAASEIGPDGSHIMKTNWRRNLKTQQKLKQSEDPNSTAEAKTSVIFWRIITLSSC